MNKNTNKRTHQDILSRGVKEIINKEHLEERISKGDKLRIKLGIDPTSSNIHIGRAVLLWKLREFQELGHKAIFIVGDFTAQIGDASDKESERPKISKEEIKKNMKTYFDQAFRILDRKETETHYNSEWLSKIGYQEIDEMLGLFGLHEFESRENIAKRLKAGKRVSLRELLYPLMQGYDSVAVKADVELGGTDQKFNLLAGRTIQEYYGQKPQDIVMTKILEGLDSRKMSSSWGNVINITDKPNDMFGKVMSISDELIIKYFELAVFKSTNELKAIEEELKSGINPRDIKIRLAKDIVSLYHNSTKAKEAELSFKEVFAKGKVPEDIMEFQVKEGKNSIKSVLVSSGLVESGSEVKRLLDQGAIDINGNVIKDFNYQVESGDIIKVGARKFLKIL